MKKKNSFRDGIAFGIGLVLVLGIFMFGTVAVMGHGSGLTGMMSYGNNEIMSDGSHDEMSETMGCHHDNHEDHDHDGCPMADLTEKPDWMSEEHWERHKQMHGLE